MEEFEIKFLEIDIPELEKKLVAIGAKKTGEYDYHRINFDYPDWRLNKNNSWLRVRTDGKETTLAYKERVGVKVHDASVPDEGMKEEEVRVDNFEKTCEIFKSIGFIIKIEVKNKRIRYEKEGVQYDIDLFPGLPPYVEIESESFEKVKTAAIELGFDPDKGFICTTLEIYKKYGINLFDYSYVGPEGMIKK